MNLKLDKNGLIFKISEDEMNALDSGLERRESVFIGPQIIEMIITTFKDLRETLLTLSADQTGIKFHLNLSQDDISYLKEIGRNREGLLKKIQGIDVCIQVDIRQDTRRKDR